MKKIDLFLSINSLTPAHHANRIRNKVFLKQILAGLNLDFSSS